MPQVEELFSQALGALSRATTWVAVAVLVLTYDVARRLWTWQRLRHIKGPFWAAFSDLWLIRATWRGESYDSLGDACKQYGPLTRIAPNYVACGDPAEVRRIWAVRSPFNRTEWFKGFRLNPPRDGSISMVDNDVHTALRSKLAPGYSGKGIVGLHEIIDEGVARFVRLLEDKYLSTPTTFRPVDMARKVQYLTLDIIAKIAFGDAFGFMDADGDQFGYIRTVENAGPAMSMIALIPWLVNILQSPLFKAAMPKDTDMVGLGRIMGTAKKIVGERYGLDKIDKPDMLGSFVRHGLSREDAESESAIQIIAGSDTTAAALRSILLSVSTNPPIYARLQAEIDAAIVSGGISAPVTESQARALPYLQACIREGLRFWPPIAGIMPRVSASDEVICGMRVPAGTHVAWSPKSVMRSREVFGEDADVFRPGRWLARDGHDGEAERLAGMQNTVDLCFGYGRWGCLGRPIALLELNKMVVELFRRFDFATLNPNKPIKSRYYGVLMQTDMWMRVTRRETPLAR